MTYAVDDRDTENIGSLHAEILTLNITSLDGAAAEPFTRDDTRTIQRLLGLVVLGREDDGYDFGYDTVNGAITVTNASDGSDVTAGSDVGTVTVMAVGR
jgi:hypothetical protein